MMAPSMSVARLLASSRAVLAASALVALASIAVPRPASAEAIQYTFAKIADTSEESRLAGVSCVSLGQSGTVVVTFSGELWRGDGQTFSQVSPRASGICASINALDEIAYTTNGAQSTLPQYLVRNAAGAETVLARSDVSPFLHNTRTYLPSLSASGSAVFHGGPGTACGNPPALSGYGIYVGPSGPTVYDPLCDAAADINVSSVIAGTMNDSLVVAFFAQSVAGKLGIYRGSLAPLVQDGNSVALVFARPVINNAGTVAFLARLNGAGSSSIYTTADGVSFTRVGGTPHNNRFSINDAGKVAYASATATGLYTGPDLVEDKVIAAGDPLDGSTFQSGFFWEEGFNNNGQVAFYAFLSDGRRGVYRADPINRAPVAVDGALQTAEDTQGAGTLGASDADGDPLTYSIVANGTRGVATVTDAATGAFTYVPNANENGADSFTFRANDGKDDSNVATASVTITAVDDPPVAAAGTAAVAAGASVSGTLQATDVDSAALVYSLVSNGAKGTAAITNAASGAYTYTANAGSSGTDTFSFKASDGTSDSGSATITVTIAPTCAVDISASVAVTSGSAKLNRKTGRYTQTVTLRNNGGAVAGPVSLVVDALGSNATLFNATGTTACAAPSGRPYVNVSVGPDNLFGARERATVTLEFVNPSGQDVTYTARVLAGAGGR
jgi:hypothetical protein